MQLKQDVFSHVKELYCTVERGYQDGLVCQYLDNVFENLTTALNMTTYMYAYNRK